MTTLTMLSGDFAAAAADYRFLLDRGYPVDACVKLVGDRHRLDKAERTILFRGILPERQSAEDRRHLAETLIPGARIAVDGYNVLFTITNYLRGHPLFIATDGFLRDAGGAHGRVADRAQFLAAADDLCAFLAALGAGSAAFFLDSPVSMSAAHARALRGAMSAAGLRGGVELVASADCAVASWNGDAAATSDSAVIAKSTAPVYDLARHLLEARYGAEFADLTRVLAGGAAGYAPRGGAPC